ncbi:hypothetical protein AJ80_05429 [Polytolypa hystricis UAMH7299]|uniref:Uncharacterized protein n=1 Tax=Polytolypa hystricis (strain UAMH7299) TaxID=1447883 RepID=A0A2B7Y3V1_POLH7|nr:hypothetical protein AJ80_05429 [Polytolypa hystricis UAMH7299]
MAASISSGHHGNNDLLNTVLQAHIADAHTTLDDFVGSDCLLTDISRFLLRAITVLSELAHGMEKGEDVDIYLRRKVREIEAFNGLDNLQALEQLEQKEKFLKSIVSHIRQLERDIKEELNNRPFLSGTFANFDSRSPQVNIPYPDTSNTPSSSGWQPTNPESTTPHPVDQEGTGVPIMEDAFQLQDSVEEQVRGLLESLSARGKGDHYCPYGAHCRFGGVDANGDLVLFERNSYFR